MMTGQGLPPDIVHYTLNIYIMCAADAAFRDDGSVNIKKKGCIKRNKEQQEKRADVI
jgi:hypothetical protein